MSITYLAKVECDQCGEQLVVEFKSEDERARTGELFTAAEEAEWELDLQDYCPECLSTLRSCL